MIFMKTAPTPQEFEEEMAHLKDLHGGEMEATHLDMDEYICKTLEALGYNKGIAIFRSTPKWYA